MNCGCWIGKNLERANADVKLSLPFCAGVMALRNVVVTTIGNGPAFGGRNMKPKQVRLFIKPYCGWCHEAIDWLDERGIEYETLDVISDPAARREMLELSGQTLAPVIEVDGEVLADFDTGQLAVFWSKLEQNG